MPGIPIPPLFTSDELSCYIDAIVEVFGVRDQPGKVATDDLQHAIVHKERVNGRVETVDQHTVLNDREEIDRIIADSEVSHTVDTNFVERANGKLRVDETTIILWDNKSKEKQCNLRSHLDQVHGYIWESSEDVLSFLVIAPEFTPQSDQICQFEESERDVKFVCIRAGDQKALAEEWATTKNKKKPFPLKTFKRSGILSLEQLRVGFRLVGS